MVKQQKAHHQTTKHQLHARPRHWRVNPQLLDDALYRSLVRSMLFVFNCMLIGYFVFLPPSPTAQVASTAHGVQEPIRIAFSKPVLRDGLSATISPHVDGTWQYENQVFGALYRTAVFTPTTSLLPEQHYSVVLDQISSLTSAYPATAALQFDTARYPSISHASIEPDTELPDRCKPITLTLDQPIVTAGAFTITTSPEQPLDISLAEDGSSYNVSAKNCFIAGEQFELTAEPSLDNTRDTSSFVLSFTTAPAPVDTASEPAITPIPKPTTTPKPKSPVVKEAVIKLAIANDHQDYALSCEAAALKMALTYKGISVSESTLLERLGIAEPQDRDGDVWGDPNIAFVGNVSGSQNSTGYGVYWDPIARVANQFTSAQSFSGWSPSDLAHELAEGNPVEIWGTIGSARRDSWHTPNGNDIAAWRGEHTRLVIGFTGSTDNPTHFFINDPAAGQLTWTVGQLRSNWGAFGNSGVVIR